MIKSDERGAVMIVSITLGKYLNGANLRKQEQDFPSAILYNDLTQGE